ncbi:hypothetical protein K488DRAFT_6309, partial [Vararia minispora EC-137]
MGGLQAYMLLDSGSTGSSLTPDFVHVSGLKAFALKEPIPLFLGCAGSRSTIQFGAFADAHIGPIRASNEYFDVVNVDRYDGILGVPFLRRHGFVLDFERREVRAGGQVIPILEVEEETALLADRTIDDAVPMDDNEEYLAQLQKSWTERCRDIMSGVPPVLPPMREINHEIPLIEEGRNYRYHLPRCSDALKAQLLEKLNKYIEAKWWIPTTVRQAAPMLCIPK